MIVAYAGRRPTDEDGSFPASREAYLTERVQRILSGLRPFHVIGSAAAGSDLIILEAAAALGIPATIIVAGSVGYFAAGSVDDKEGWRERYNAVVSAAGVTVEVIDTSAEADDTYRAITSQIVARSNDLALKRTPDDAEETQVLGLLLSGGDRGAGDHTEDLARRLRAQGNHVLRLDPKAGRDSSPVAFVAMPFGERRDPTNGLRRYDADATWNNLLLPALLSGGYRVIRTDSEASRQLIDSRMILDLLGADLVVADLATLNANVFWELGVRHTARRSGTLVVSPAQIPPPFDVRSVPVHPYNRSAGGFSDREIIEGLRGLAAAISGISSEQRHPGLGDSPVYAVVPELSVHGVTAGSSTGTAWMERISVATELRRADELKEIDRVVEISDLSLDSKRALHVQIGFALIRLRCHADAVEILKGVVDDDPGYDEEELQQKYAHALIRAVGDATTQYERLRLAELRLRALDERRPGSGETLGLLGSVAKERARLRRLQGLDAEAELRLAAESYLKGFTADPLDYYPGVNAVALHRLLGTHYAGVQAQDDLASARRLLPVVQFSVERLAGGSKDVWSLATLGELSLQQSLLQLERGLEAATVEDARRYYTQAAVNANPQQIHSMVGQLELMIVLGDSPDMFNPIIEALVSRL